MTKNLIRYTIGGMPKKEGFQILEHSIYNIKEILNNEFDFVICYNNVAPNLLKSLDVDLIDQSKFIDSLSVPPKGVAWKLYPPRLSKDSHEIFIDNDVLINKMPHQFFEFINSSDSFIFTEGLHTTTCGRFHWPLNETFNSGVFGIPPNFDFKEEIESCLSDGLGWVNKFDEQGLVGSIFFKQKKLLKIKLNQIAILENSEQLKHLNMCGYHFVGINCGINDSWKFYRKKFL